MYSEARNRQRRHHPEVLVLRHRHDHLRGSLVGSLEQPQSQSNGNGPPRADANCSPRASLAFICLPYYHYVVLEAEDRIYCTHLTLRLCDRRPHRLLRLWQPPLPPSQSRTQLVTQSKLPTFREIPSPRRYILPCVRVYALCRLRSARCYFVLLSHESRRTMVHHPCNRNFDASLGNHMVVWTADHELEVAKKVRSDTRCKHCRRCG